MLKLIVGILLLVVYEVEMVAAREMVKTVSLCSSKFLSY